MMECNKENCCGIGAEVPAIRESAQDSHPVLERQIFEECVPEEMNSKLRNGSVNWPEAEGWEKKNSMCRAQREQVGMEHGESVERFLRQAVPSLGG